MSHQEPEDRQEADLEVESAESSKDVESAETSKESEPKGFRVWLYGAARSFWRWLVKRLDLTQIFTVISLLFVLDQTLQLRDQGEQAQEQYLILRQVQLLETIYECREQEADEDPTDPPLLAPTLIHPTNRKVCEPKAGARLRRDAVETLVRLNRSQGESTDLQFSHLERLVLSDIDLKDANLTGSLLNGADLIRTDLSGALLGYSRLRFAYLYETVLRDAKLDGADLTGAVMTAVDLTGANLRWGTAGGPREGSPELHKTTLAGALLPNAKLVGASLESASLRGITATDAEFIGTRLVRADLSGAILRGSDFTDADLEDADLSGAELHGANLSAAKNLTQGQVDRMQIDDTTQLPQNLRSPPARLDQ